MLVVECGAAQGNRMFDLSNSKQFVSASKWKGKCEYIIAMPMGKKPVGVFTPASRVDNYGDVLVVPAGKYDVHVSSESNGLTTLEEDLDVEAGKLVQLE
jgi:hypothetical protein